MGDDALDSLDRDIGSWTGDVEDDDSDLDGALLRQTKSNKTCFKCGMKDLYWSQVKGKWRLFNEGTIHVCRIIPLKAEGKVEENETLV